MNVLDVALVVGAVVAVAGGWRQGFVARLATWAGMAVGLVAAIRGLPWLLRAVGSPEPRLSLVMAIAVVFAAVAVGQAVGVAASRAVRRRGGAAPGGRPGTLDRLGGALAGLGVVVAVAWLLLPVVAGTPGPLAAQAANSTLARTIDQRLPEPPDAAQALRAFMGEDPFPEVFASLAPTRDPGPPPAASGLDAATAEDVRASVAQVAARGCGRQQNGSGFVLAGTVVPGAPGAVVITNAHVVAGADGVEVRVGSASSPATVVAFDAVGDVAVLVAPGVGAPGLPLAVEAPAVGSIGGVFGYPGGGPLRIAAARVSDRLSATGRDIYGRSGATRDVLELASDLAPGDSGAALVTPAGEVVGVIFAVALDRAEVAYALTPAAVSAALGAAAPAGVPTGPCVR